MRKMRIYEVPAGHTFTTLLTGRVGTVLTERKRVTEGRSVEVVLEPLRKGDGGPGVRAVLAPNVLVGVE